MKTLILTFLLLPLLGIAQTYDCEFLKFDTYTSSGKIRVKEGAGASQRASHSLNTSTTVNDYNSGYSVELETIFEDNEFSAYITLEQNDMEILKLDFGDNQPYPKSFRLNYQIKSFSGQCDCNLK